MSWYKDTRPLTSDTNDLVLKNVKDDDSGDYKCVGTNVKGDANSEATVHAIGMFLYSLFFPSLLHLTKFFAHQTVISIRSFFD